MNNLHLYILHLPPITGNPKIDKVCETRLVNLIDELATQGIEDYTIIDGFFEKKNTTRAIHRGHKLIVEIAKKQNFEMVCVAEDDLKFTSPESYAYFIGSIPKSFDFFAGCFYAGTLKGNRIMAGASGILTLYCVHQRFYDTFLSLNVDSHLDREIGSISYKYECYVCSPMCVVQRGGYSINLRRNTEYSAYHSKYRFL